MLLYCETEKGTDKLAGFGAAKVFVIPGQPVPATANNPENPNDPGGSWSAGRVAMLM